MRRRLALWLFHALTGHDWRLIIHGRVCFYCRKEEHDPGWHRIRTYDA